MASTPWGEMPVHDAHVHFFSPAFYAGIARQKSLASAAALDPLLQWEIPESPAELAARWIAELDLRGVDRCCLIASAPGDEASVAAAVAAYPQRFFGHFMLDPTQTDAVERVAAAAANPHLHCLCLFPALHRFSMQDARVTPLLELAASGNLAVFVHCGVISIGVRKKLGLPTLCDMRFSNPLDLHAVALRFPTVRFIVPHFGAGLFREALMLADLCPNVWLDTSSTNRWMDYEGLDLARVFRRGIDLIGSARLLFGTDSSFFPRGWNASVFEQQCAALHSLGLGASEVRQIFGESLRRFYALRPDIIPARS